MIFLCFSVNERISVYENHSAAGGKQPAGVNQSVIFRRLRREGEVTPSRTWDTGSSHSRLGRSLALPDKPYPPETIPLIRGPDSDKSHFGSYAQPAVEPLYLIQVLYA
uniref:Uncharacterized protein n=1 Tax=Candidatus Kentrum sp. FM TaxID=2126340 RepID=A0A450WVL6_9GAMM|nr:MAG: hypothetical protein BECKFM1743A_GA0114220_108291 [Candidatus Kentron sp. FM]VFK21050.1 MAG: hypothetical protein BECKFM1743B_GA0114221_107521 [Candidatus Kentron sp. FM]